jgi:hypothetical protein
MDTAVLENNVLLRDTWLLTQEKNDMIPEFDKCSVNEYNLKERIYFEPDADFYNSISADEFKKKAQIVVKNAYNRYINECNIVTTGTGVS